VGLLAFAALARLLPRQTVVEVDLPLPPEAGVGWLQPLAVIVLLVCVVAMLRHRTRMRKHGLSGLRSFALGAAVGNALLDLGAILMPNRPAAVCIQRLEEEPVVDEAGDGRDPPIGQPASSDGDSRAATRPWKPAGTDSWRRGSSSGRTRSSAAMSQGGSGTSSSS
jgi:hypothetical protein